MLENIAVSYAIPIAYLGLFLGASSALVFPLIKAILDLVLARENKIIIICGSLAGVLLWMCVAYFFTFWAFVLYALLMLGKMALEIIMVRNYKSLVAILGVVAVGVVFLICYMSADNMDFAIGERSVAGPQMQLVEAGIFTFYSLLLISVLAILYSSVSRYFK